MGYLDGLPKDSCPFCHRALSDYLSTIPKEKWVSVDVPLDIIEHEWVVLQEELYAICKFLNKRHEKGKVRFNLSSILNENLKFK